MPDLLVNFVRQLASLPAQALLGVVWLYQRTLSPAKSAVFGPTCGCRFSPTCSHYAARAIRAHGAFAGAALAAIRLLKCTPLHPGGDDPVPERLSRSAFALNFSSASKPATDSRSTRTSARPRPVCHRT